MYSLLSVFLLFISYVNIVCASVINYDWELTWVNANPDGRLTRPVIGINGQFPCPTIHATTGDRVIVNLKNSLGNESTSIHWHGLHQQGSNAMDGTTGATQCPILPGDTFTYNFTVRRVSTAPTQHLLTISLVNQTGSFWWHSHHGGQMPDGLRGPFIVHDTEDPYAGQYEDELVLTFSD